MNSLKRYKIIFLVPIFEREDCVEDLIQNIHTICPNSAILFHINSNCSQTFIDNINKLKNHYNFCYILPEKYPSEWASGFLTNIYIQMMNWCIENDISDYIYITHSNSLLINPKLESFIYSHEIFFPLPGTKHSGDWWEKILLDQNILDYVKPLGDMIYVTSIEGAAMNLKVAQHFVDDLIKVIPNINVEYPSEEYYIPTSFMKIKDRYRYMNCALERWGHTVDHVVNGYKLGVSKNEEYILNIVLNNQFDVLSKLNLYSIKKIERKYNYPFRELLRNHFGYNNVIF